MNKNTVFASLSVIFIIALTIVIRSYTSDLLLQGEADARQVIVSSKASGQVKKIYVQRGDNVQAGDTVLELDSPELTAKVKAAEAVRDQAKIVYDNAAREYQRNAYLSRKGLCSTI